MIAINYDPERKTLLLHDENGRITGGYCGDTAQKRYLDLLIYLADKVNYESLIEISQTIGTWLSQPDNFDDDEYFSKLYLTQQFCLNKLTEIEERNKLISTI